MNHTSFKICYKKKGKECSSGNALEREVKKRSFLVWDKKQTNKLIFSGCCANPQNLQQKPQPLLPLQQLQHQWHKERWLWRFCLMWFGIIHDSIDISWCATTGVSLLPASSGSCTPVNGSAELSRMQIKASTSVTATAMLNAFILAGVKWFSY